MKQLTDQVWLFGNGFFNYFLVGREEAAIIECGSSAGASLFARQWEAFPDKPDVKYLIVMHSHFDHIGGIPMLKSLFPSALVVGSAATQKILSKDKAVQGAFRSDAFVTDSYLAQGLLDQAPAEFAVEPIQVDIVVGEGDNLQLGDSLKLHVLDAPGHSPCSIAIYLESDQVMFVSDAAGYRINGQEIAPVFFQDYNLYLNTLKRLSTFPTRCIGLAHGDLPLDQEVPAFYRQSIAATLDGFEYIRGRLAAGDDEERINQDVFERYFKGGMLYYPADIMKATMNMLLRNVKAVL